MAYRFLEYDKTKTLNYVPLTERETKQIKGWTLHSQDGFYSTKEWLTLRDFYRMLNPLCEHCIKNDIIERMYIVDHIQSIDDAPELALDDTNLQSLCVKCHQRKTNNDKSKKAKIIQSKFENYD